MHLFLCRDFTEEKLVIPYIGIDVCLVALESKPVHCCGENFIRLIPRRCYNHVFMWQNSDPSQNPYNFLRVSLGLESIHPSN